MSDDNNKYNIKIFLPLEPQPELDNLNNSKRKFLYYNAKQQKIDSNDILIDHINNLINDEQGKYNKNNIDNIYLYILYPNDDSIDSDTFQTIQTLKNRIKELEEEKKELYDRLIEIKQRFDIFQKIQNKIEEKPYINLLATSEEHEEGVCSMNIFPSGKLISSSKDKSIKIYGNNFEIIQNIPNAHDNDINYIEIINENNFVTCSNDKYIKLWNKKENKFEIIQNIINDDEIKKVINCPNGDLISCSNNGPIIIWNKNNGEYKKVKELWQNIKVWDLLLLEKKDMLISGGENGIIFWNYNLNNLDYDNIYCIHFINDFYCVWNNSMCKLDDERIIINGNEKGLLKVISVKMDLIEDIEIPNIKIIKEIKNPFLCYGIKLIENKGKFLVGGEKLEGKNNFNIRIFNSDNYEYIETFENVHEDNILGFVDLNDNRFVSFSDDKKIKIWELYIKNKELN